MNFKNFLVLFLTFEMGKKEVYCRHRRKHITKKIFHGDPVQNQQDFPFAVQLLFLNTLICGCSSLKPNIILTAGHCVHGRNGGFSIIAGSLISGRGGQMINAQSVNIHPTYHDGTFDYDCAIIRLNGYITYSSKVRPVQVTNQAPSIDSIAEIAGWGLYERHPKKIYSAVLRKVVVKICSPSMCAKISSMTDRMICAGYQQNIQNAAEGDSGGPLMVYRSDVQVGLTSWGNVVDGLPFTPLAYTNLAHPAIKQFINSMSS